LKQIGRIRHNAFTGIGQHTNTELDINPALYDTIGRIFRAGFRFNL
jgi:hypothetical protein